MHDLQGCTGSRKFPRQAVYCVERMLLWKYMIRWLGVSGVEGYWLSRCSCHPRLAYELYEFSSGLVLHRITDHWSRVPTKR